MTGANIMSSCSGLQKAYFCLSGIRKNG